jgi:hypothetical protein
MLPLQRSRQVMCNISAAIGENDGRVLDEELEKEKLVR